MHQKKAISPIIAIIIILLITIAIAGAGYSYISAYWGGMTSTQIEVVNMLCVGEGNQAKVTVKNIGTSPLETGNISVINTRTGQDISHDVLWSSGMGDPDLVLELRFDEGTGTLARDTSGNGNDGTLINNPEWIDGMNGKALYFDGTGGSGSKIVSVPDSPSLIINSEITIGMWVKISGQDQSFEDFLKKGSDRLETGTIVYNTIWANGLQPTEDIWEFNEWFYLAYISTATPARTELYINGKKWEGSTTNLPLAAGNLNIGTAYNAQTFTGTIDEVRIYSRALSPDEIAALASNSVPVQPGKTAVMTHTCDGLCRYSLSLGKSSGEASIQC